jgi:hypothetical protein
MRVAKSWMRRSAIPTGIAVAVGPTGCPMEGNSVQATVKAIVEDEDLTRYIL